MEQINLDNTLRSLRKATLIWVALVFLTCLAGALAESSILTPMLVLVVLISLVLKAQLIIDNFMDLKGVKLGWRFTMFGFPVSISILVFFVN